MSKTSYIRDESGEVVGIRDTSDDGRQSVTYAKDGETILGEPKRGEPVDIADHHEDGTSTSYNAAESILGGPIAQGRKS